jgi:nicotinamide-nucleotide amidase
MQAEIIAIGTELLLGRTINTNAAYISQGLNPLGIELIYHTTVDDNKLRMITVLKRAMHRSDVVIVTGGLGPTVDDLTLEVIAQVTQKKLSLNSAVLKDIKRHFQRRHIAMPKENIRQALIPEGAKALKNEVGTAPGLVIPYDKKVLIALPGVPAEMRPMLKRDVISYLARRFAAEGVIISRDIKTFGLAESQVNQKAKDILKLKSPLTCGIYVHTDSVDLNITAGAKSRQQAERLIKSVERKLRARLKDYIYGYDTQTMEEVVAEALKKSKKKVAVAESCTGGLISKRLTNISGSSRYFPLGVVAYSNKLKQAVLGISKEVLKQYGAVSKKVAGLMAENIQQLANTDLGLGVTGIAGPTGDTKDKPVGLVYIALATPRKIITKEFHFHGSRNDIRLRASQAALDMLRRYLVK